MKPDLVKLLQIADACHALTARDMGSSNTCAIGEGHRMGLVEHDYSRDSDGEGAHVDLGILRRRFVSLFHGNSEEDVAKYGRNNGRICARKIRQFVKSQL